MKLQAIFWDYPQFLDERYLNQYLNDNCDERKKDWILQRFLEYGRVIDTLHFFSIENIHKKLPKLKLSTYTQKKWKRLIEVYYPNKGK